MKSLVRALGCLFTAVLVVLIVQPSGASASNIAEASPYGDETGSLTYEPSVGVALNQDYELFVSMVQATESGLSVAHAPALAAHSYYSFGSLVAPNGARHLCSFSGETQVLMADGTTKPISEVEVGDWVLAEDPETGERGAREVTHLWVHEDTIIDLEIDGHDVATTEDHPFWNHTDKQWQRADVLDPGDLVLTADGATLTVGAMDWGSARTTTAYNLTVDDIHTYFIDVGGEPVLVHNTCPFTDGAWVSVDEALDAGQQFVGSGADELGPGVFRSAIPNSDGSYNVFRMTDSDLSTSHAPAPHVNFEVHTPNARGGFDITENIHVFLTDFP